MAYTYKKRWRVASAARNEFERVMREDFNLTKIKAHNLCSELIHQAQKYQELQLAQCNDAALVERAKAEEARVEHNIRALVLSYGIGVKFGGDPRGYCVKLLLPSERYNTWGGKEEGWGVPTGEEQW